MLILQDLSYIHPNKELLFDNIHLTIQRHAKVALVGNNGIGKSTLLKIIAGGLPPAGGLVKNAAPPYYVPQHFGQFNQLTIAQALGISDKLMALRAILEGQVTEANMALLDDDWTLEERSQEALAYWQLGGLDLEQPMSALSGGQKTKVFLAGISIHEPDLILLDEPSNHLDTKGRQLLYDLIQSSTKTLVVVSHDRALLHMLNTVCELSKRGVTVYGGNYAFYQEQKAIEANALNEVVKSKEKALRMAKEIERETAERKQRLDARGRKKQEKAGVPTIAMNTLRNNAEKSTARLKGVHEQKVNTISQELQDLRSALPDVDQMKIGFDHSALHKGKVLLQAKGINYGYGPAMLWTNPLDFHIVSGERIALKGLNGSGKTTLIRLLLGEIVPLVGSVYLSSTKAVYIDQDYTLIDNSLNVYEQAQRFNTTGLQEHEIKIRLARFLFTKDYWDRSCSALCGGEKMRLVLCCFTIQSQAPDMILLDEPTNNLDMQNVEILTAAINDYQGTLIVVSHDQYFLEQIGVERVIELT